MYDLLEPMGRFLLGVVILYLLFFASWLWLHIEAFTYGLLTKDMKWKSGRKVTESEAASENWDQSVEMIFIRHGESTWNDTFNRTKFPPLFAKRLIYSALMEISLIISGNQDSWFYDSPISELGLSQAEELRQYLAENKTSDDGVRVLLDEDPEVKSTIVVSNLRRAISTAMVGLWDRISSSQRKVIIHSALQEVSRNPDTLSITPAGTVPVPSWMDRGHTKTPFAAAMSDKLDPVMNYGNKALDSNGLKRMKAFNEWAFQEDRGTLICVGHSLWFRYFFREFLPDTFQHDCKTKKMKNCAAIGFTLRMSNNGGDPVYSIDPKSLRTIYLGYK